MDSALPSDGDPKQPAALRPGLTTDLPTVLASIVESSDDAIISKDLNSVILTWNKGAEKIFGYSAAEMVGTSIMRLIPAERQDEENHILGKIKLGEKVDHFETQRQTKDGRLIHVSVTASPIKDVTGQIVGVSKAAREITARRAAEIMYQESNLHFQEMLENVELIAMTLDRHGTITFCNDFLLRLSGWKREEIIGQSWFDYFLPESSAEVKKLFLDTMANGQIPTHHQNPIKTKTGELRTISWNNTMLRAVGGTIIGTASIGEDITERERAEEARRAVEARYRSLFDYSPFGTVILDSSTRYLDANITICRMLGYTHEEFIQLYAKDIVAESEIPRVEETINEIQAKVNYQQDWKFQRKDGSIVETEAIATMMPDGNILAMIRDISERKRAEEVLRKTTQKETGRKQVGIIWDLAVILALGILSVLILNYTDLLQGPLDRFVAKYHDKRYLDEIFGTLTVVLGSFLVFAYRRWRDVKTQFSEKTSIEEALRILHGELEKRIQQRTLELTKANETLVKEIAERQKAEAERKKSEEQFRQLQKMEGIGQLAGGVAHDFNNILAVIQMQSDLLKMSTGLSADQTESIDEISVTVQRAAALTRQLLLFSRREVFQPRDVDLSESITNTAKMLRRILGEHMQMQLTLAPEPMLTHADAGMLDQVLLNLTVNARDAMPKGGRLTITTSAVEFDDFAAKQSPQARAGSFVCLSVSDSGTGIPPEIMPKIFEPFFTTKGVGKGTGIGLATVFGIVQQHQGWVNVYSEVGHGTTFRIYLPRLLKGSVVKILEPGLASASGGQETILLVEDDPSLRLSVRKTLAQLGYRILEAPTGVKALEVWKQNRNEIHLLLTDLVMPDGMTGKDLGEKLLQENPKLKVIYMSGYSSEVVGTDFPLQEGDNFLTKPFQAHKLAQTVREKLDSSTS